MKMDAPETTQSEGGGLTEPGTYHCVINAVVEGQSSSGKPIDGITVTFEVLAGTVEGTVGKTRSETLFAPSMDDQAREAKDGSPCMSRKKIGAIYLATNQIAPKQLGQPIDVVDELMVGQQCVVKFATQMEKDGNGKFTVATKYIQISYSDIFHVDDPDVKAVPKNADALSLIPKEARHNEAWFGWKKKTGAAPKRESAAVGSVADDLF